MDSILGPGTSVCHGFGKKKQKKTKSTVSKVRNKNQEIATIERKIIFKNDFAQLFADKYENLVENGSFS